MNFNLSAFSYLKFYLTLQKIMDMITKQEAPVVLTEGAINEIRRLITESSDLSKYLRIGAKGGGCSGLSYVLEFDAKQDDDKEYHIEDITFIISPSHLMYIKDITIDWSGGLNSRGFTFVNPNATTTCGCGTSFSV